MVGSDGESGGPPVVLVVARSAEHATQGADGRRALQAADPARPLAALHALDAFHVHAAADAEEAAARLDGEPVDAVLLDLDQLSVARADVLERLQHSHPAAALIAVGDGGDPDGRRAAELGLDDCVGRDESPAAIARCIRGAIECRRLSAELELHRDRLAASDARFHSIIERTVDGIVIIDMDGIVRFMNPAAERLFGRSAAELVGEDFGFAMVAGETTELDLVQPAAEEPIVAELRVTATTWEGAAAQLISLRDVTDRKRAERQAHRLVLEQAARAEAERASRRFRFLAGASAALDASLDPATTLRSFAQLIVPQVADWCVIDLVEDGRIRRVAGVHADASRQPLLDELQERYPPHDGSSQPTVRVLRSGRPEVHRALDAARVHELAVDAEHARLLLRLGVHSSMTLPLQLRKRRIGTITFVCGERDFDDADLALAQDLASRAARALENARLYRAAVAANQAKADFLAVMSHELRTPLNAIIGYTDLLLSGISGTLDDTQSRQLRRVHTSALHLLQIIEEILIYASTEAGRVDVQPATFPVGRLIEDIVAIAEPLVRERGLDFTLDVPQRQAELHSDVGKLRQIALNLLTNAVKFTDEGGVRLCAVLEGDELLIAVSDTGIGIAPADIPHIFEPFWQAEQPLTRHFGGTGLGLSVSQQLARLLGGRIDVVSEPHAGSTFTLRVPARLPL
jgi:signal transduction histidine kinase